MADFNLGRISLGTYQRVNAWLRGGLWFFLILPLVGTVQGAESTDAAIEFFERKIRPLLAESCYSCHGEEKQKGHLRLDSAAAIHAGGENGPILVPGKPENSRLVMAVSYQNVDLQMPPKQRLSSRQVAELTEWIRRGAPMPESTATSGAPPVRRQFQITDADRQHWAFRPVPKPVGPKLTKGIDALIAEQLHAQGLTLSPEATPRELVRRVYFDLIGLPPTPEEIEAYQQNSAPDRYEQLVDQLLARPQYGERWARHWLDVVRFAQSNGYERDGEKLYAWRYRDYVINAFNTDKSYNRFIQEQIAGDELPDASAETVTATGFQRLGVFDDEPDDKVMASFDALDDVLTTTGAAFLGLTIGCARCHDHKFEPISQADYYSMLAFFRGVRPFESSRSTPEAPGFSPLLAPADFRSWQKWVQAEVKPLAAREAAASDEPEKRRLQAEIQRLQAGSFDWTLAVRESGPQPPATHVLVRGNAASPGGEVKPAFLSVIGSPAPVIPVPPSDAASSGRRRVLADWIASPQNPLTARVMVNRVWHHHFGRGLVKTTTDFGRVGSPPTNPKLLDWLAAEFIERGWSLKQLHRLILHSQTYRQASRNDHVLANQRDPENRWLWRQNLRRLEAEAIRDNLLSISGELNLAMGGRGFFPQLSGEVLAGQSRPGLDWDISSEFQRSRRSIYTYIRRTMAIPLLEGFDYSNNTSPVGERGTTTVAPQALLLLNDDFLQQQASAMARRLIRDVGERLDAQIERAYQLALGRSPTVAEKTVAQLFHDRQAAAFSAQGQRLTFRPDVGDALAADYFKGLRAENFLRGPQAQWQYHRGFWAPEYEGIRVLNRDRSPLACWTGGQFTNGSLSARLILGSSCDRAGVLFRVRVEEGTDWGYELRCDVRQQQLCLVRQGPTNTILARISVPIVTGRSTPIRLEFDGPEVRVWWDHSVDPVLETKAAGLIPGGGQIGIRTWGGSLSVDDLEVRMNSTRAAPHRIGAPEALPANRRALESVCLLLLNLNETVYID